MRKFLCIELDEEGRLPPFWWNLIITEDELKRRLWGYHTGFQCDEWELSLTKLTAPAPQPDVIILPDDGLGPYNVERIKTKEFAPQSKKEGIPPMYNRNYGRRERIIMENFEYRIIDEKVKDAQKILNQWRHSYKLNIISVNTYCVGDDITYVTILLTRERNG